MLSMRVLVNIGLVVGIVAQGDPKNGNVELVNDPGACAAVLTEAVADITRASNSIVHSVADCPPKTAAGSGKDTACAAGIVETFTAFSAASEHLAEASKNCANTVATFKGAECGADVSSSIKSLSASSGCLIAATESCKPPEEGGTPFGCVVDVVDVVDALANAAKDLNSAVNSCREVKEPNPKMTYLYNTWLATGCPAIPSPDWLQWGFWFSNSVDKDVLEQMFEWCTSAGNGNFHDKHHSARLCCGSNSGSCDTPPTCNVQTSFTGAKPITSAATGVHSRTEDTSDWYETLSTESD